MVVLYIFERVGELAHCREGAVFMHYVYRIYLVDSLYIEKVFGIALIDHV